MPRILTHQTLTLLTAATTLATSPLHAQAAPTTKRPDYLSSRFDEQWPRMPDAHGLDALKHIEITPDDRVYLTIGGQWRYRAEAVSHYLGSVGADRNDVYGLDRILLSGDLHVTPLFRAFVEARDAQSLGRDLPGLARTQDRDRWDFQNAFAEARWTHGTGSGAFDVRLRGGRQEIALGRERIVGISDWSNSRRTFDGGRAIVSWGGTRFDAFLTRPVVVQQTRADRGDSTTTFWGTTLGGAFGSVVGARAPGTWQLYVLGLEQTRATFDGVSGRHHRLTYGGRAAGATPLAWLTYDVEGALQRGHVADRHVAAGFLASELTATARHVRATPSIAVGYDIASGDRDSTDRTLGTFAILFPTAHSHGGYADVVGRPNASEARLVLAANPARWLQTRAAVHHFDRVSLADAAYTKSATVLRAVAGSHARDVGSELDLTSTATANRHLRVLVGYSHFAPGAFLRTSANTSHAVDWGFAGTTFTF